MGFLGDGEEELGERHREQRKEPPLRTQRERAKQERDRRSNERSSDRGQPEISPPVEPSHGNDVGAEPIEAGLTKGNDPSSSEEEVGRHCEQCQHDDVLEDDQLGRLQRESQQQRQRDESESRKAARQAAQPRHLAHSTLPKSPAGRKTRTMISTK